jgi:ParB family chromosome partitioning protein
MLVENTRRRDLSITEEARGYAQLALAGLSAARIAKATGSKPAQIKRSLALADSPVATATTARYDLSLDQALAVAEFDMDAEAVKRLVVTATKDPRRWDHVLARLRADRDARAGFDAAVAQLVQAGLRVLDEDDLPETARHLSDLVEVEGNPLDHDSHASCPGHVVVVDVYDHERQSVFCVDPALHGHHERYAERERQPSKTDSDGKLTEDAKAERRAVIEGNRAWRAAREVRRGFLRDLLARKTAAKGTLRYAVEAVVSFPERVGDGNEELVAQLLGAETATVTDRWDSCRSAGLNAAGQASDARLPLILLAQVAADAETALHDHVWRNSRPVHAARWLSWLATTGYQLSDIEARVVTDGTPFNEAAE